MVNTQYANPKQLTVVSDLREIQKVQKQQNKGFEMRKMHSFVISFRLCHCIQ